MGMIFFRSGVCFLAFFLMANIALAGGYVESFKKSYKESYDKHFIKSFRRSFIKSCKGNHEPAEAYESICECAADEAISQLSVKQLSDMSFTQKHILENILPVCTDRYKETQKRGQTEV